MSERPHLWMTVRGPDRDEPVRFFLVPRGVRLPAGKVRIRNMQLGTQLVDGESLRDFEVDAEAAQAHIDAGWSSFVGRVQGAWNDLVGRPGSQEPPDLRAWLGVSPGQVLVDEDKRRQGGRSLLARAGRLVGANLDDEDLDRVEDQLKDLRETISREGERLAGNLERAADAAVDAVKNLGASPGRDDEDGEEEKS